MIRTDVLIVGGGPAGAACAWRLKQSHIDCLVLDQVTFPRFKPCAGWMTPDAVRFIQLDPQDYPHSFTTFDRAHISISGVQLTTRGRQHAIRRIEFDDWLLRRSGAPVQLHTVKSIAQDGDGFVVDGEFSAKYLVGAGGTYCPVYRSLFKSPQSTRTRHALVAAQEDEFAYPFRDPDMRLWYLEDGLPGYAWYVPKQNGYVNVGIGGMAEGLKANNDSLKRHWNLLVQKLDRLGLVRGYTYQPSAHSYYLRQDRTELRKGNAFLVGDAAGLATSDMGEGIGAGIRSGVLAADAIAHGSEYKVDSVPRYSLGWLLGNLFSRFGLKSVVRANKEPGPPGASGS